MSALAPYALRVWHIPQIPMQPFTVDVASITEGRRILDILASYDLFQYENRIKPDYCNASGLSMWNAEDEQWEDFDPEDEFDVEELPVEVVR